ARADAITDGFRLGRHPTGRRRCRGMHELIPVRRRCRRFLADLRRCRGNPVGVGARRTLVPIAPAASSSTSAASPLITRAIVASFAADTLDARLGPTIFGGGDQRRTRGWCVTGRDWGEGPRGR